MDHSSSDAQVIFPYLKSDSPVYGHAPQIWGPTQADTLASAAGGWHNPVTSS